jgi:hypothetical protein
MFAQASFARKLLYMAILPQLTLWIGRTVVLGSIIGVIVVSIVHRENQAAPAAV